MLRNPGFGALGLHLQLSTEVPCFHSIKLDANGIPSYAIDNVSAVMGILAVEADVLSRNFVLESQGP